MRFKPLMATIVAVVSLAAPLARAEPSTFVRAGGHNVCMPDHDGLICWGSNLFSQLGDGSADGEPHPDPHRVQGLPPEPVRDVQIGVSHVCALVGTGAVWCWGANLFGELGDGTRDFRRLLVQMREGEAPLADADEVRVGYNHTCVRREGSILCVGANNTAQLGRGVPGESSTALRPVVDVSDAVHVSTGFNFVCVIRSDASLWCWGLGYYGQLGFPPPNYCGADPCAWRPGRVADWTDVEQVATGAVHTCAIRRGGSLWCWGDNTSFQTGHLEYGYVGTPRRVDLPARVLAVTAGARHTCAILAHEEPRLDRSLWCWGDNAYGQLGNGYSGGWLPRPAAIVGPLIEASAGTAHTCAVRAEDRRIWCWGRNLEGEAGIHDPAPFLVNDYGVPLPTRVTCSCGS